MFFLVSSVLGPVSSVLGPVSAVLGRFVGSVLAPWLAWNLYLLAAPLARSGLPVRRPRPRAAMAEAALQGPEAPKAPEATSCAASSRATRFQRLGSKGAAQLGKGSYGTVYLAWDTVEECLVAVKEQDARSDDSAVEMCTLQALGRHPTLVRLVDVFVTGQTSCLVLEYLPSSLSDVWRRAHGFLDWDLCSRYGQQLLEAAAFIHSQGVAHRDISLSNVLVCGRTNAIKLGDFGMAASAATFVVDRTLTTIYYRAPEAVLRLASPEGQAPLDMWSVGVVLAALWAACHIFRSESSRGVFRAQALFLGAGPELEWPECRQGARWEELRTALPDTFPQSGARASLLSPSVVRRTLGGRPKVAEMLAAILQWHPGRRLSAQAALRHEAWHTSAGTDTQSSPGVSREGSSTSPSSHETPSCASAASRHSVAAPVAPPAVAESKAGASSAAPSANSAIVVALAAGEVKSPRLGFRCGCKGSCGRAECNRVRSKIHYLKTRGRLADIPTVCDMPAVFGGKCESCAAASTSTRRARADGASRVPPPKRGKSDSGGTGGHRDAGDADGGHRRVRSRCMASGERATTAGKSLGQPPPGKGAAALDEAPVAGEALAQPAPGDAAASEAEWPWELRAVKRHGVVLATAMGPGDLDAFAAGANAIVGPRKEINAHDLLQMWVLATLKLPCAIALWRRVFCVPEATTKAGWQQAFEAATEKFANGILAGQISEEQLQWEASQLLRGRLAAFGGPSVFLARLGFQDGWGGEVFHALPQACRAAWSDLLGVAAETQHIVQAPQSGAEALRLMDWLCDWFGKFPPLWRLGAGKPGYIRKALMRNFCIWFQARFGQGPWLSIRFSELRGRMPDKAELAGSLEGDPCAEAVSRQYGVSAHMLSCWTCEAKAIRAQDRANFHAAAPHAVQGVAKRLADAHNGVPPCLRHLAAEVSAQGS